MELLISNDALRTIDEEIVSEEKLARPDCVRIQQYRQAIHDLAYLTRKLVAAHQASPQIQVAGVLVGVIYLDTPNTQTYQFLLSKDGVIANYNPHVGQIPLEEFETKCRENRLPIPFAARSGRISSIDALLLPQRVSENNKNMYGKLQRAFPEYQEPVEALWRELSLLVGLSLEVLDHQAVLKKQQAARDIIINPRGLAIPQQGILVGFYNDSEYVAEFQHLAPEYVQKMPLRLYPEGLRVVMPCIEKSDGGLYSVRTRIAAPEEYIEIQKQQYQMLRERIPRGVVAGIRSLLAKERRCDSTTQPDFVEHIIPEAYTNLHRYFDRHRTDAQRAVVNM